MTTDTGINNYSFLDGGGEAGMLIRSINWTENPLGPVTAWPQSLKTTLSIILHSRFPMFLFWGPELICFYNDAYRPSLGNNGKHPIAMGQRGKDCWPEIWPFIKPLIDQVLAGDGATWHEDQLLPIYRNGKMEDVYWTFSYSPVIDESGKSAGVFVTCTETTEKVKTLQDIQDSKDELQFAVNAAELGTWDLNPVTGRFTGNSRLKEWFGLAPVDEIALQEAIEVIAVKDREQVQQAIAYALNPASGGQYNLEYTIINAQTGTERIVRAKGKALFNEQNTAIRFNGTLQDITQEVITRQALVESETNFRNLVMQAPVGIAILRGDNFIVELANRNYLELTGKTEEQLVNKPLWESMPEVKSQGFDALLKEVMRTGRAYHGNEQKLAIMRHNQLEDVHVNFVYEPIKEADDTVSRILVVVIEVTSIVQSKHKIKEAEERARLAADAVDLGTFDLNLLTGAMTTSERFNVIFGFDKPVTRSELVSVIHPEDHTVRLAAHRKALNSGYIFYEVRIRWKDQSLRWVRVEGKVYYDQGKAYRILGTLLDITEQKRLAEEQQKLITLVDNSVDLMSILNMDGTNSYINQAGRAMLGFEDEAQVSRVPITELHAPEDYEMVAREVLPSVMNQGYWSGKMLVRHLKTQEIFPVFNNCMRIDDPVSGKPIAVGAVMRDLRPELAAKQALADSEQLLRSITSAAPASLWMADEEGAVTYVNQTWTDWTGRPYESHLGDGWLDAVVDADRQGTMEKYRESITFLAFYESEFRINHADGSIRWCAATGKPQYRSDGAFSGYIGACIDITEQKQLQQQKDDFIGIASHELKTPVTSLKAYTQVLEKMLIKKGDTREAAMISKMDSQLNRLTSLIGDLLDVTKINSGKLQFNDREFDFNLLVSEIAEDLQRTTDKHKLVEDLQLPAMVFADRERIGQVIINLITNAIKYSPQHDTIILRTRLEQNEVVLCVQDFGIGIPADKQSKVFEQFYRVSGDIQHTFPGLGLGLYISSEIIKRENGRIWVTSEEGSGSSFCFALPLNHNKIN